MICVQILKEPEFAKHFFLICLFMAKCASYPTKPKIKIKVMCKECAEIGVWKKQVL